MRKNEPPEYLCAIITVHRILEGVVLPHILRLKVTVMPFEKIGVKLSLSGKDTEDIAAELNLKVQSVRNLKNRVKVALIKEVMRLRTELET